MRYYTFLLLFLTLGCAQTESQDDGADMNETVDTDSSRFDTTLIPEAEVVEKIDYSLDGEKVLILNTTEYHGDEVEADEGDLDWMGLFRRDDGSCYLRSAEISATRVNDAVLDGLNEKTGWGISTNNPDDNIVLIHGLDFLKEREVREIDIEPEALKPKSELILEYNGRTYRLFAEGKVENLTDTYSQISDYRLKLSVAINGEKLESTLIDILYCDPTTPVMEFVGDIDGDGILDFLVNTSDHYNVHLPTLYISGPAEDGEVVKRVADRRSVGC